MFKKCFVCLLPESCLRDNEPPEEIPQGFYAGKVQEVRPEVLVLALYPSVTTEDQVLYGVDRQQGQIGAGVGDAIYLLKKEEDEILTIPSQIQSAQLVCEVLLASYNYILLKDRETERTYVFPYTAFHKDPMMCTSKHALLIRSSSQDSFDIVIEEDRLSQPINVSVKLSISDSAVLATDDSLRPRRSSLRPPEALESPGKFPSKFVNPGEEGEGLRVVESEPAMECEKQNFSFSNPFVIKEEDDQSSSFLTIEGDSGSDRMVLSPMKLPEFVSSPSEENSSKFSFNPSAFKNRVQIYPYPDEDFSHPHPDRFSRHRLPIHLLKQPGISTKQIDQLSTKAGAWRSPLIDKNSFFCCVAVAWLENFARVTTSIIELDKALGQMSDPGNHLFSVRSGFEETAEIVAKSMQDLRDNKGRNVSNAIVRLQPVLQQEDVLYAVERYVRMICANYMDKLAITPELANVVSENIYLKIAEIEGNGGVEYDGLVYNAVGEALKMEVEIVKIGGNLEIESQIYRREMGDRMSFSAVLLKKEEMFHLLYNQEQLSVDGYDLDTHCFEVMETV